MHCKGFSSLWTTSQGNGPIDISAGSSYSPAALECFIARVCSTHRALFRLQTLAAFLVYELSKGAHSFWYPYLRSLPQSYTCLSYFSADEAAQLQVTALSPPIPLHIRSIYSWRLEPFVYKCHRTNGLLLTGLDYESCFTWLMTRRSPFHAIYACVLITAVFYWQVL